MVIFDGIYYFEVSMVQVQQSQQNIDGLLGRNHNIPVEVHRDGTLPRSSNYRPIRTLTRNGLLFTPGELIHAIGCKMANLPMNEKDESLNCAHIYTRILNLESPHLVYKEDVGYSSDFQGFYSQGLGVGFTCLIASKSLNIPWDQLEPIPGPEKRFDYRGNSPNLSCMFESKGTKYRDKQNSQIENGLDKKSVISNAGVKFDICLVVSSFVGCNNELPRIIIADPDYNEEMLFSETSQEFFRYRHFTRVLQFIGATPLARQLYIEANYLLSGRRPQPRLFGDEYVSNFESINIQGDRFIGSWFDSWAPIGASRYDRWKKFELPSISISQPNIRVSIFQGLLESNFKALSERKLDQIEIKGFENITTHKITSDGLVASFFPDGTILIMRVYEKNQSA